MGINSDAVLFVSTLFSLPLPIPSFITRKFLSHYYSSGFGRFGGILITIQSPQIDSGTRKGLKLGKRSETGAVHGFNWVGLELKNNN